MRVSLFSSLSLSYSLSVSTGVFRGEKEPEDRARDDCAKCWSALALSLHPPPSPPAYISIHQHTSAYISIHQHTSAYVSVRQHPSTFALSLHNFQHHPTFASSTHSNMRSPPEGSMSQSKCTTRAVEWMINEAIRWHVSCCCASCSCPPASVSIRQHPPASASISQHTAGYGRMRQHTYLHLSICKRICVRSQEGVARQSYAAPLQHAANAHACWRMLAYAGVCWRTLAYAANAGAIEAF